jgi:hypothetical protein
MTNDSVPYYVAAPAAPTTPEDLAAEYGLTIVGPNYAIDGLGNTYTYGPLLAANGLPISGGGKGWTATGKALTPDQMKALGIIPADWTPSGGGGGAAYKPGWEGPYTDPATGNMAWYDPTTGATSVSQIPAQGSEAVHTLSEGQRLIRENADGTTTDITPGGTQSTIINRDDGIYSFDPDTKTLTKLADFGMTQYQKEQLALSREQLTAQTESDRQARALEAAQAGFPSVAFSEGGYQYQQVPVSEQMLAGEQPSAAFRRRAVGAPEGTPWEPVPAATGTAEELGPGAPMTEKKALGLAQVFARGGYMPNTSPYWRLAAEGGGVSMGGGLGGMRPYRAQELTVGQRAALRAEQEGAPALAGGPVTAVTAAPATTGPVTVGQRLAQKTTAAPATAPVESMAVRQQRAVAEERRKRARRNMGITVGQRMAAV